MKPTTLIEQLLFSTVRVEVDKPGRVGAGTAFVFDYTKDEMHYLFLVTNRHVVSGASTGRFFFTEKKDGSPDIGNRFDVEVANFEQQWRFHHDPNVDIAIMPLVQILNKINAMGKEVFIRTIDHTMVPSEKRLADLDAFEEIIFIGYPSGLYDTKNLIPLVRRGTTATPAQIDYQGLPAFLIDASVFPGSSGSPVLVCNQGGYSTRNGFTVGSRLLFLGIVASTYLRKEKSTIEITTKEAAKAATVETAQMIDLGTVFKARAVLDLVLTTLRKDGLLLAEAV